MFKNTAPTDSSYTLLTDINQHYNDWTADMMTRKTNKRGWDDITKAYLGYLDKNWPFLNKIVDPRIRTAVEEKNARLLNAKLKGRIVPRDNHGDNLKARIHNEIIDFQWDTATHAGTMLDKWSIMDKNARLYGSSFALVPWVTEYEKEEDNEKEQKEVEFDGNEFIPISILDVGLDPACQNVRDAQWVQVRERVPLDKLEAMAESKKGTEYYESYKTLCEMAKSNRNPRSNQYVNINLSLKGLPDRAGADIAFPSVTIVTEYRPDRFIKFAPVFNLILEDCENPYDHGQIPVVQLKYYATESDPYGESEIAAVLSLWMAIQMLINGYMDSMMLKMRPPLKVLNNQVKPETLVYGPGELWYMDTPNAISEFSGSGDDLRYFQATYTMLVSAFNSALGELSQGTSNLDPTSSAKTATEIKKSTIQQNSRDQRNQTSIAECIQNMMLMWISNNQQFLFTDKEKQIYILKILGTESYKYFVEAGLNAKTVKGENMAAIADVIAGMDGNLSDSDVEELMTSAEEPAYPVTDGKSILSKMEVGEKGDAHLNVIPEDLEGSFNYIASVQSMASTAANERVEQNRQTFQMLVGDPQVTQLLNAQGYNVKVKEIIESLLESQGDNDPARYFEKIKTQQPLAGVSNSGMMLPNGQQQTPPTEALAPAGSEAIGTAPTIG